MKFGTKTQIYITQPMLDRLNLALDMISPSNLEISKITGIDSTTICKYRHGERYPNVFNLIIISDESGFTIDWMLKGSRYDRN